MELTELNLSAKQLEGVNSYLEETLNTKLQSEGDKIRGKYSKEIKNFEIQIEELKGKLPVEKSEAEIEMENRLKAIEDREKEVAKKEQLTSLQKQLSDKGLNGELAKYLNIGEGTDLETYLGEIAEIVGKQATNTYKPKSHANATGITKEQFKKMGVLERTNLYNTNKELYDILSK